MENEEDEDENAKVEEASPSECFVESMCEYLTNPYNVLNHIDLSGMGFNQDSLLSLGSALSNNDNIQSIHLSDNGLRLHDQKDFMMELLDLFIYDVNDDIFKPIEEIQYNANCLVSNSRFLKGVAREWTNIVSSIEVKQGSPRVDSVTYQKHVIQQK